MGIAIAAAKVIVASICRVAIQPHLLEMAAEFGPGIVPLTSEDMPPREIIVFPQEDDGPKVTFDAIMRWHRDAYVPTVTSATAECLVTERLAKFAPQSLLNVKFISRLNCCLNIELHFWSSHHS